MSPSIEKQLAKIVVRICKIIDIKFFSIDFAIIDDKPIVVEINSGVMLEKYSSFDQQHYQRAYKIYEDIITELLK
jgi:glutathione synthase/RimK-type ligase-like ATP-grasp enzyme